MSILNWLKNRFKKESDEDVEKEIDNLLQKIKEMDPIITNPHNIEYQQKSTTFFQSILTSRDNFINWITGLATGAIFFVFSKVSSEAVDVYGLKWAGRMLFATIASALFFKLFLEARYGISKFEINILGTLWEGEELNKEVKNMLEKRGEVSKDTKKRFLENYRGQLRFLDKKYIERLRKSGIMQLHALSLFYYLTLGVFMLSIILLTITYLW